jgi:hypothetical protein
MTRFFSACVCALMLGGLAGPVVAQDAPVLERQLKARPVSPPPQAQAGEQSAHDTRGELRRLLATQYPPALQQVLRLDPSLLTNQSYLEAYPALAAFIAQHPEVARNPTFFVGGDYQYEPWNSRSQAARMIGDVLAGLAFFLVFGIIASLTAWGFKTFVDYRRWLRQSKIQTDAHSKLLDRLTSNEDLLAYIQSPAGRQFLEAAPVPIGPRPQTISAPVNRILWSVQVGVILILVGSGLWYTRGFVIEEVDQVLSVLGIFNVFLGAGFVLSALVAYALSKMLGLFDTPALHPHA